MAYKDPIKKKEYAKAWREEHKEEYKEYMKAWREANKEQYKVYQKAWHEAHKDSEKSKLKAWREANKEQYKVYQNSYQKAYYKSDLNSLGKTKQSIRNKSRLYLMKYGQKIEGYQIHHCCTYDEPYKFIYCPKEMHRLIHAYLKQHNIDADSDHYQYIKHLLDDTVIKYNID